MDTDPFILESYEGDAPILSKTPWKSAIRRWHHAIWDDVLECYHCWCGWGSNKNELARRHSTKSEER